MINSVLGFVVLGLTWEFLPRFGVIDERFFPQLSVLLKRIFQLVQTRQFWIYVGSTTRTWALGLLVATVLGVILGLIIGLVPGARRFTHSTIEFLRPIPSVALIPGVILVFGTRFQSGIVLITYASVWPVLLQILYGLNDIDPVARETSRSFHFSFSGYIRYVAWPTLLPYLVTGIRLAASIALVLAVTAEMVIGTVGIGQAMVVAQNSANVVDTYAYVIVAGVMGVMINVVVRIVEKRTLWWHPSVRNTETL